MALNEQVWKPCATTLTKILPCGGLVERAALMLPVALDLPQAVTAVIEQDRISMGLKKPITPTLKPVSCMY